VDKHRLRSSWFPFVGTISQAINCILIVCLQVYETLHNYSVPDSAFSNGKGSFSVPQIPLKSGTPFMLIMSDATGFGSGGTTSVLTVGAPVANNNCNTTVVSPDFTFDLPTSLQQCK
jgi:hypothetical protein